MQVDAIDLKLQAIKYILDNGYERGETSNNFRKLVKKGNDLDFGTQEALRMVNNWMETICSDRGWGESAKRTWAKSELEVADGSSHFDDIPMICSIINCALIEQPKRDAERAERDAEKQRKEQARQDKLNDTTNSFAGEVKSRVNFTVEEVEVDRYVEVPTWNGGSYPVMKIKGSDGHTYSWSNTQEIDINPGDKVEALIKDNYEAKDGTRISKIWRAKITPNQEDTEEEPETRSGLPFGEALTPQEKIYKWNTGERIVNIRLCSDEKLYNYFQLAKDRSYFNICSVINDELRRRNLPELPIEDNTNNSQLPFGQ